MHNFEKLLGLFFGLKSLFVIRLETLLEVTMRRRLLVVLHSKILLNPTKELRLYSFNNIIIKKEKDKMLRVMTNCPPM